MRRLGMQRHIAPALILAAVLGSAGCSAFDPYPTAPGGAEPGQPPGPRVAVCYNSIRTPLAAVQIEAQQECPSGTTAEPVDTDWYVQYCPLLLPARATFVCLPKP